VTVVSGFVFGGATIFHGGFITIQNSDALNVAYSRTVQRS
jgi:hypothetical protein